MSEKDGRISTTPTPWAVNCRQHGLVYLTEAEYIRQMEDSDSLWKCPDCHEPAEWDDATYEAAMTPEAMEAAWPAEEPDDDLTSPTGREDTPDS